jgi:hypothetical protein
MILFSKKCIIKLKSLNLIHKIIAHTRADFIFHHLISIQNFKYIKFNIHVFLSHACTIAYI